MGQESPSTETVAVESQPTLSIVIPAFNEEGGIGPVISQLKELLAGKACSHEILVVNDGSTDGTAEVAARAGAEVVSHAYNIGNGAAVKTGLRSARGEFILLMDGDGQHTPEDAWRIFECLREKKFEMVVGARTYASHAGQHRALANTVYNRLASYVVGRKIPDLTSGLRVMKRHIAEEFVNLLPNTFSYPSTITLVVFRSGYSVGYVPIEAKVRTGKSKIRLFSDGMRFLLIILRICTLVAPMRVFIPLALVSIVLGVSNLSYTMITMNGRVTNTSTALFMFAVQLFVLGLISEQVTQLFMSRSTKK
ncbi:MAG: glycosyltransferase family 2 protein [Candidatus Sumerlaeaceae bacterium]|nr:glycosyltransferase family 2 protein [Candidatus Sumerlaeaceae bacterium]